MLQKICLLELFYVKYTTHLFILPQKILHHHLNHAACFTDSSLSLNPCIYTFQHIPQVNRFYLACIFSKPFKLLLLHNKFHMERIDHGNPSWYILSMFSVCHALFTLFFLGSVFSSSNSCDSNFNLYVLTVKCPLYLKKIEWHWISWVFNVLEYTMAKYVLCCLNEK